MKRLRVLVSAYACNPIGSLQSHPGEDMTGWRLVEQLNRFHDLCVITRSYNREGVEKALAQGALPEVRFHFIQLPSWLRVLYKLEFGQRIYYYLWQILAWRVAKRLHRKLHFEVAHHLTFGNDWIPSFIGAFLPVPFIWGPVGGGQRTPQGLFSEYTLAGKLRERGRTFGQWIGRTLLFSRKQCLKKAKAILVCNYETKTKMPKRFLDKVHLFPVNGISPDNLDNQLCKNNSSDTFLVLTAGRLHRLKGFDIAIRAFNVFAQHFPKTTFEIVGQGPEEAKLHQLVNALRIRDRITFTQWLTREELLARMRESDVFLFPSFRDGGGAVVVEAMASGIPVVCLDNGGPGFHIQKEWGIKIFPKDPEFVTNEMVNALEKLYVDKDLRMKMGRAARKRVEECYLWDRLGKRMQEIYQNALINPIN